MQFVFKGIVNKFNSKIKLMESSITSFWTRLKPWIIILSALPAFFIVAAVFQVLVGGLLALSIGENFTALEEVSLQLPMLWELLARTIMAVSSVVIVIIYWVKIFKNNFLDIGFTGKKLIWKELLYGLIVGVLLQVSIFCILVFTGQIEVESINFSIVWLLFYLVIYLEVGFWEEFMFRGYLLGTTMKRANKYFMLILFAFVFSLLHFLSNELSLLPAINIFLAGIVLGIYYIHTKRLWFSISLHFTWNFLLGPVLGSGVSGHATEHSLVTIKLVGADWITGGDFGFEGSILMTFILVVLILVLELKLRRKSK